MASESPPESIPPFGHRGPFLVRPHEPMGLDEVEADAKAIKDKLLRARDADGQPRDLADVLEEAKERYARPRQRIEGAERRAATFQGAAAIAASLVVGASGLLL